MIWGSEEAEQAENQPHALGPSGADALLGFNEPERPDQAAMSVDEALEHWPTLLQTGKRLGSPAPAGAEALKRHGWLRRFMDAALNRNLRVDFIAVHYYARTPDTAKFREFLERVHDTYRKPIWVTEWGLVHPKTWHDGLARYDLRETACFFLAGAAMLDDLDFVERHAWFAAFDGGNGWHLNSHAIAEDGSLTDVGRAILAATGAGVTESEDAAWRQERPRGLTGFRGGK